MKNWKDKDIIYSEAMANINKELKVNVDTKKAANNIADVTKAINEVTHAVDNLQKALAEIQKIEIGLEIIHLKKPWWQFWH